VEHEAELALITLSLDHAAATGGIEKMRTLIRQFKVLLWKEWRQQRALFLALAIGTVVSVAAMRVWAGVEGRRQDVFAGVVILCVLLSAGLLAGVSSAGERGARALRFALQKPIGPRRMLAAKFATCGALWLVMVSVAGAVGWLCATSPRLLASWEWAVGAGAGWGWLVFCCCFLTSACVERPSLAVPLGAALAGSCLLAISRVLGTSLFEPWPALKQARFWLVAAFPLYAPMVWLAIEAFAQERRGAPPLRRLMAGAGRVFCYCCGLVLLAAVVVVARTYTACLALEPRTATSVEYITVSPDGRRVAFVASLGLRRLGRYERHSCVLDRRTGETRLLARFNTDAFAGLWSPDGRHLVYWVGPGLLHISWLNALFAFRDALGVDVRHLSWRIGAVRSHGSVVVHDTRSGESQEVMRVAYRGGIVWWVDDRRFVLAVCPQGRLRLLRYNVQTRRSQPIPLPENGKSLPFRVVGSSVPALAVYAKDGDRLLALYNPQSETWTRAPFQRERDVLDITSRGPFGLIGIRPSTERHEDGQMVARPGTIELLDMRSGATKLLYETPADNWDRWGGRFSPSGRWALYYGVEPQGANDARVWLYEVETGRRRKLQPPGSAKHWGVRFTPDESRLVWTPPTGCVGFYVQRVEAEEAVRIRLPDEIRRADQRYWYATHVANDELVFACGHAQIYRIGLDGSGLEQLFPVRRRIAHAGTGAAEETKAATNRHE